MLIVIKTKILLPQLYVTSVEGSPSSAICALSRFLAILIRLFGFLAPKNF